ncbi:hypothetical protein TBLA_0B08950 [Henningerozyma blattae CBS 6284]|uniref:Vacuolar ATPase assembly integral membrane protein VPH2 n=1 Tax=Henningerozyma blattae (strain ATCC 34711 / CBS 6284 / DSM 70876 / NBRC 10599 / NRRL Y-10934 / UCD 77-7) TaxID=1071380 RepID=I2H008_HENB6|nr:hypothetical protein TBLA_0B08950 [Tetrapisispora blattae CBS 6284]CCH59710.1 hypothetical protein TBLA_0B08950 [Tetrapisispora blattae CBS 6284]
MFQLSLNKNLESDLIQLIKDEKNFTPTSSLSIDKIKSIINTKKISPNDLLLIYKNYLTRRNDKHNCIKDYLTNTHFVSQSPKKIPGANYTPEFKNQLNLLKLQLEENEYQNMVRKNNLHNANDNNTQSLAQINREIKEQVTTIFNILVSCLSVVVAIWYWTSNIQLEIRVLLCLFFGILVLIADIVVYNSYLRKIDEAKFKEKNKIEKKKLFKNCELLLSFSPPPSPCTWQYGFTQNSP